MPEDDGIELEDFDFTQRILDLECQVAEEQRDKAVAQENAAKSEKKALSFKKLAADVARSLQVETIARAEAEDEIKKLTQAPHKLARVMRVYEDHTADLSDDTHAGFSPRIKPEDIAAGTLVRVNPKTGTVVEIAPTDSISGEERIFSGWIHEDAAMVQDQNGHRAVARLSPGCSREDLEVGSSRVIVEHGLIRSIVPTDALRGMLGMASSYTMAELPDVTFDDVAGHDELIQELRDAIMDPYDYPAEYAHYKKKALFKFLFYGPPGNGKTSIAKAIARLIFERFQEQITPHAKGNFIAIKGPELSTKWIGETERFLREIFAGAERLYRATKAPVVIFFDDCESFLLQRGMSNASTATMDYVNQFNTLVDGVQELQGVSLILSTNRIDLIDTGSADRMQLKRRIPPPTTREMAEGILRVHLRDIPIVGGEASAEIPTVDSDDPVSQLMDRIFEPSPRNNVLRVTFEDQEEAIMPLHEFLSGRLLTAVIDSAKTNAIKRDKKRPAGTPLGAITFDDLNAAMIRELDDNDSLPSTRHTVEEWLLQRGDKRKVVYIEPLRDKSRTKSDAKRVKRLDGLVQ